MWVKSSISGACGFCMKKRVKHGMSCWKPHNKSNRTQMVCGWTATQPTGKKARGVAEKRRYESPRRILKRKSTANFAAEQRQPTWTGIARHESSHGMHDHCDAWKDLATRIKYMQTGKVIAVQARSASRESYWIKCCLHPTDPENIIKKPTRLYARNWRDFSPENWKIASVESYSHTLFHQRKKMLHAFTESFIFNSKMLKQMAYEAISVTNQESIDQIWHAACFLTGYHTTKCFVSDLHFQPV